MVIRQVSGGAKTWTQALCLQQSVSLSPLPEPAPAFAPCCPGAGHCRQSFWFHPACAPLSSFPFPAVGLDEAKESLGWGSQSSHLLTFSFLHIPQASELITGENDLGMQLRRAGSRNLSMRETHGLWFWFSLPHHRHFLVSLNGIPGGSVCTASGGLCWPDSQELLRSQRCVASLQLNREGSVLLPVEPLLYTNE